MTRKEAREYCFKLMFEYEVQKNSFEDLMACFDEYAEAPGKQREYVESVVSSCLANLTVIDEMIERNSKGWKKSRLPKVTLSALRVAVCEILYMDDIPNAAAMNEAVELAKNYDVPETVSFINGVLGGFARGELAPDAETTS